MTRFFPLFGPAAFSAVSFSFVFIIVAAASLGAEVPLIFEGGVVNAASHAPANDLLHGVAAGGLASIFGRNLAEATETAAGFPLPRSLAGTTVTIGGLPAPLLFVSPGQVNFQVPGALSPPGQQRFPELTVTWTGGDPDSAVLVAIRGHFGPGNMIAVIYGSAVPASAGRFTFPTTPIFPGVPPFEILVSNFKEELLAEPFTASGLDSPGRHGWRYDFRFADIR